MGHRKKLKYEISSRWRFWFAPKFGAKNRDLLGKVGEGEGVKIPNIFFDLWDMIKSLSMKFQTSSCFGLPSTWQKPEQINRDLLSKVGQGEGVKIQDNFFCLWAIKKSLSMKFQASSLFGLLTINKLLKLNIYIHFVWEVP